MPYYEVLCLAHGRLTRTELKDVLKKTCEVFMNQGGIVTRLNAMGADGYGPRKLAYRIRQNQTNYDHGFFVNVSAFATPSILSEVDRQLKLDERILRHKTLRLPLTASLAEVPEMDAVITRSGVDESDPSQALRSLIEQHAKDFPDGFDFNRSSEDDVIESLKEIANNKT